MTRGIRLAGLGAAAGGVVLGAATVVPFRGTTRPLVPLSIIAIAGGALGLYRAVQPHAPRSAAAGLMLTGTGLGLGFMGMAASAAGIVGSRRWAHALNTGEHAGLPLLGTGALLWGHAAWRSRALGAWSWSPALVGVLGVLGATAIDPTLRRWGERAMLPQAFCAAWVALGVGLVLGAPSDDLEPASAALPSGQEGPCWHG